MGEKETAGKQQEQRRRTADALSEALLYMKFLQGIPVAGVAGGISNTIYLKKITDYAELKYKRRFLRTRLAGRQIEITDNQVTKSLIVQKGEKSDGSSTFNQRKLSKGGTGIGYSGICRFLGRPGAVPARWWAPLWKNLQKKQKV